MIKILGTVKGVSLKSSLDEHNKPVHKVAIQLELSDGVERGQEITELMTQIAEVTVDSKQPTLPLD
jgi:hypothetical protein